jgi:outer membrane protein assembly factor BamE (lipoprotein component of BamABCDE complex)
MILSKLRRLLFSASVAAGIAGALAACAPLRTTSGYQAIDHQPKEMKVGMDTKSTVLDQLGSPSAQGTFDANVWYYVSQNASQIGFHNPRITKRSVVAITFNKADEKVIKIDTYSLKDGHIVAYNGRETPTRGRELSGLEQLLGNVGRGTMLPEQQDNPGQRPGGP